MAIEKLNDITIRNAKPGDKKRLDDGGGLYVLIKPTGAKWWRFDYTFEGKRKTLSLGVYPQTTLARAREKAKEAREDVANGINPSDTRKEKKQIKRIENENKQRIKAGLPVIGSFGEVAMAYFMEKMQDKSESHRKRTWQSIEANLMPHIKNHPIQDIKPFQLLGIIKRVDNRAPDMAKKLMQITGQIFRYAVANGYCESDITQSLRGALSSRGVVNYAAVTDPKELGDVLRAIESCSGSYVVKAALKLAPMLFVRPGELRTMEWEHINLADAEWCYLVTKTKTQHVVPLAKQAIEILRNLQPLTGESRYVFQSDRSSSKSGYISDKALLEALKRIGIKSTMHGFRATARTILDEQLGYRVDFIEHQLAHAVKDPNGRAYNRTAHLSERHKMMQSWADYLDGLKAGAVILPFKRANENVT